MLGAHHAHIITRGVQAVLDVAEGAMSVFDVGTLANPRNALVSRKDGYGMRVISSTYVAEVARTEEVYVHEIALGQSGVGGDDASMFNTIRDTLMRLQCSIVTITGLTSASDVLFKWCAEFTKSNPWCYIFFDEIESTWLLPENQNRQGNATLWLTIPLFLIVVTMLIGLRSLLASSCRLIPSLTGGAGIADRKRDRKEFSLALETAGVFTILNSAALLEEAKWTTAQDVEWKSRITALKSSDAWMLITGSPGVGKTYHMQQEYLAKAEAGSDAVLDQLGRRVVRLDGSNDLFTLIAMADWLERAIDTTDPVLLIVDEFHMLPSELKEQLLQWVGPRRFIKLVMIANRYDFGDQVLFAQHLQHNRTLSQRSVEATRDNIIHCRGSVDEILEVKVLPRICEVLGGGVDLKTWRDRPMSDLSPHSSRIPMTLLFARLWLQSTSMLVGDDMLSMRDIEKSPILSALQHARQERAYVDDADVRRLLREFLKRQMSHLEKFSTKFVNAVLFVYSLDAVTLPVRQRWDSLTAPGKRVVAADGTARVCTIADGLRDFTRWVDVTP
jgi:hypothetical protein